MTKTTKVALRSIKVNTKEYELNHQKAPRGVGVWAFSIGNKAAFDDVEKAFWTGSMNYSEAVKMAKLEAQKQGATIIYVMP